MKVPEGGEVRSDHLRRLHHSAIDVRDLVGQERSSTVCVLARNEEESIGPIVDALMPLVAMNVVDDVVVLDESNDATAEIAESRGATVYSQSALCAELGPVVGKGDAMWRALSVVRSDVICFVDGDSASFGSHYVTGLVGAIVLSEKTRFAKGTYRRPFRYEIDRYTETGGGRVTELMAKPLLGAFFPDVAQFAQPLAGEIASERSLLARIPFYCGYAVDLPLLLDAWRLAGIDGLAEVDLDSRQNRHRPLEELGELARAVLAGVLAQPELAGLAAKANKEHELLQRPPMAEYESLKGIA
jgi:glucosyl-3-phosphoglycerate synthase